MMAKDHNSTHKKIPIFPDCGTNEQRKNYIDLLNKTIQRFQLRGLPRDFNSLFENYSIPKGVPVKTPLFVFTEYPQRPNQDKHDFSTWPVSTSVSQAGPANILFNEDFTVVFGRVSSAQEHYGYRIMLLRNDKLRIYAVNYTIDKESCRYSHESVFSDLQELIVLAFYRPNYSTILGKYRSQNNIIDYFLKKGQIMHEEWVFWPITCFDCKNAHYTHRSPVGKKAMSCDDCLNSWLNHKAMNEDLYI